MALTVTYRHRALQRKVMPPGTYVSLTSKHLLHRLACRQMRPYRHGTRGPVFFPLCHRKLRTPSLSQDDLERRKLFRQMSAHAERSGAGFGGENTTQNSEKVDSFMM